MEARLDIEGLYNKGRKYLNADEQKNRNVINLLKYGSKIMENLRKTYPKNGPVYAKYHKLFKVNKNL